MRNLDYIRICIRKFGFNAVVRGDVMPGNQVDNKLRYLRYPSFTIYYM